MNTQQQVYLKMQNKNTVNDFTQIATANLILSCEAQQTLPHTSAPQLHSGIAFILMVNSVCFPVYFPVSIMSLSELTRKQTL